MPGIVVVGYVGVTRPTSALIWLSCEITLQPSLKMTYPVVYSDSVLPCKLKGRHFLKPLQP